MTINVSANEAFTCIAPIYLSRIFPGTLLIPGVADTSAKLLISFTTFEW
jgi:hypothetical protein